MLIHITVSKCIFRPLAKTANVEVNVNGVFEGPRFATATLPTTTTPVVGCNNEVFFVHETAETITYHWFVSISNLKNKCNSFVARSAKRSLEASS